ncbi:Seryl-tRNA synthetase, class IIa [Moelleriella libera RCEF 2490]|uniref:serine--tRNA ligase n=1 Tax=Moelleriella libera RCEF 2490 TaxID=1081109 RepID=A0A162I865_9HYPO|nr:Seryl-tRNA synthetase, class IIa [Moelleriella libera RCEF 2490]
MPAPKQRKIAIVGSRSVGKSSLAVQFVDGHFVDSYYPTIENTFSKTIRYKGQDFATEIVDTAGQDEYSILNSKHFIGIHGYMLVYSVSSLPSFEMIQVIREKILNHLGSESVPIVIVGNKSDLRPEQRQVSSEEGKRLSDKFQCGWTEASARYNENVGRAFELLITQIEKSQNPGEAPEKGNSREAAEIGDIGSASKTTKPVSATIRRNQFESSSLEQLGKSESQAIMLDVIDFIAERGGNPEKIRESQRRRGADVGVVDTIIAMFDDHRRTQYSATQINSRINDVQKRIGTKKKAKENADDLLKEKDELEKEKKILLDSAAEKDTALKTKLKTVGNYVHDSVPVSNNEDHNTVERIWAPEGVSVEKKDNILSHHEVLLRLDGYDPERGVKVVGHRGYFLRQWGAFLNQALINYGLEFLSQRGYTALQTPQFMLRDYMGKTAQLEQFDEELYKVTDGEAKNDKYLIATSEQPISAYHADEWLLSKDLPIKYAGYSTCYRREAGAHGRDAWGIYRVHQFEKIEQFLLTDPEKSWDAFNDMITVSEEFYKSLKIPYQIVSIVSGALNNAASKKFDLEAWFPFQGEYKELVSCSNCTDYQSRALEIRFGTKAQTEIKKKYVHCLNSTLCATTRTMCCILENYQTDEVRYTFARHL